MTTAAQRYATAARAVPSILDSLKASHPDMPMDQVVAAMLLIAVIWAKTNKTIEGDAGLSKLQGMLLFIWETTGFTRIGDKGDA